MSKPPTQEGSAMTRTRNRLLRSVAAAAVLGSATTLAVGPAQAATCTTSAQYGSCTSGSYTIYNDEWGSGHGSQTLWVNSASNWGVYSTQPSTSGVKAYPNASLSVGKALNSLSKATSSFNETLPSSG